MNLRDFEWYAPRFLKIKTKIHGLQPFKLRKYQLKFLQHLKDDFPDGIIRSVSLKPRQAGWSTLIAGLNVHGMVTQEHHKGIMLADKHGRTQEVHGIYSTFVNNIPREPVNMLPMIDKNNMEEISFDNPDKEARGRNPGLGSGFQSETAQDPNAGRSGTRKWAHLTEFAFYPYADSIDEGVQNSIPLAPGTAIYKESTAYGMAGIGAAFYNLWQAAVAGDSIYRPFFVPWYEIDDYALPVPRGFIITKAEADLIKRCPEITNENLVWRRLKLKEYAASAESVFTPEERFKQDFPSYPEESFLSTGRPVFDLDRLKSHIDELRRNPPEQITVKLSKKYLAMYPHMLKVFKVPTKGHKYVIGGDVAEGVEGGDFSDAYVLDATTMEQVAVFHGHIDPDHFGHVLVDLAEVYNRALLNPEINNMGHTTLQAIKERGYLNVYMRAVYDEIDQSKETLKMGWRTTKANKQTMLSRLAAFYRDHETRILDIGLLMEMLNLVRESNGDVELTGKDRVVAACLAYMALDQLSEAAEVSIPNKKVKLHFEKKDKFREVKLASKS